jgi:metal-sulfur cluster biosynthetic enzyme
MLTEANILDALRDCYDPEFRLNIVDLGRVQSVTLKEDGDAPGAGIAGVPKRFRAAVTLLAAGGSDEGTQQAQLAAQIQNRLAGVEAVSASSVCFTSEPMWTPALISPAGRRILKLDQAVFPILNNRRASWT